MGNRPGLGRGDVPLGRGDQKKKNSVKFNLLNGKSALIFPQCAPTSGVLSYTLFGFLFVGLFVCWFVFWGAAWLAGS